MSTGLITDSTIRLPTNGLHVWQATYPSSQSIAKYWDILSDDEKMRAQRLINLENKANFIWARAVLRQILSRYLDDRPEKIEFTYSENGKPEVINNDIKFNLSHSKELICVGVSNTFEVGIDVEYMRKDIDYLALAKRFFSSAENKLLNEASLQSRPSLFYQLWTLKEAITKVTGRSLFLSLEKLEISLSTKPKGLPGMTVIDKNQIWKTGFIHSFLTEENYMGALATVNESPILSYWQWE